MPESKNNKWLHGPARFDPPVFPGSMAIPDGLLPGPAVINLEVGDEVVLYLKDSTPFINTLAKTRPFNLRVHAGVARNLHGCLGFFIFWIPSPYNPLVPLVIYDAYVNPRSETQLGWWRELAFQTHWHVLLLNTGAKASATETTTKGPPPSGQRETMSNGEIPAEVQPNPHSCQSSPSRRQP